MQCKVFVNYNHLKHLHDVKALFLVTTLLCILLKGEGMFIRV